MIVTEATSFIGAQSSLTTNLISNKKMNKQPSMFRILLLTTLATFAAVSSPRAADLTTEEKQFLAGYEKVRAALSADDIAAAKSAAKELGEAGAEIANTSSLKDARSAFEKLSSRATTIVAGQTGYFVMYCPMLKKDWVQTSDKPSNPYYGKTMLNCGELKKVPALSR